MSLPITKLNLDDSIAELPTISPNEKYKDESDEELKLKFFAALGLGKQGGAYIVR